MSEKTLQEAFDAVKDHMMYQGRRSVGDWERGGYQGCMYRGREGDKCAIGALIDDKYYKKGLEGAGLNSDKVRLAIECSGYPVDAKAVYLYRDLQKLHDDGMIEEWENGLIGLAYSHELEYRKG